MAAKARQVYSHPAIAGELILLRRSSSKVTDDDGLLEKQTLHHSIAMKAVLPLVIPQAALTYKWSWHHLNGVQSRTPPPPFGVLTPPHYNQDYYNWSLTIQQAVANGTKEIVLVVQSAVGWCTDAGAVQHWLKGAQQANISIKILFWHAVVDPHPCPFPEGEAWCNLYEPVEGGALGYYLYLDGAELIAPLDQPSPAKAFLGFCGAVNCGTMGEFLGPWQRPYRNTLMEDVLEVFMDELESREMMDY